MYKDSIISNVDLRLSESLYNKFHSNNSLVKFPSLILIDSYQFELQFNFPVDTYLFRIPISLLNSSNQFEFNGSPVQKFPFLQAVCVGNNIPFYIDNDYFYLLDSSIAPKFVFTAGSTSQEILSDIVYLKMLKLLPVIIDNGFRVVNIQESSTIFYCNGLTILEPFTTMSSIINYFDFSCSYKVPKSLNFPMW